MEKIESLGPAADWFRSAPSPHRLNVGCGDQLRPGWVNCDNAYVEKDGIRTQAGDISLVKNIHYLQHDARTAHPAPDGAIDCIYSEHYIERIKLHHAPAWLREAHRILKPGGNIRIGTPDLDQFARGYLDGGQALFKEWGDALESHTGRELPRRRAFLFNNQMRRWGCHWLYDFAELTVVLHHVGFGDVVRCAYRQGANPGAPLDQEWRRPGTLYVEAVKPL